MGPTGKDGRTFADIRENFDFKDYPDVVLWKWGEHNLFFGQIDVQQSVIWVGS